MSAADSLAVTAVSADGRYQTRHNCLMDAAGGRGVVALASSGSGRLALELRAARVSG